MHRDRWHAALAGIGWSQPFDRVDDLEGIGVPTLVIPGTDALHDPDLADVYVDALPHGLRGLASSKVIADFVATL